VKIKADQSVLELKKARRTQTLPKRTPKKAESKGCRKPRVRGAYSSASLPVPLLTRPRMLRGGKKEKENGEQRRGGFECPGIRLKKNERDQIKAVMHRGTYARRGAEGRELLQI